jgi:hypothetical protein
VEKAPHAITWPNGVDFDPAILHDWPRYGPEMAELAASWRVTEPRHRP